MIDFHSHILPQVDDGSKSIEESIALLDMLTKQDVNRVIATPHFYANDESVTEFINRRNSAFKALKAQYSNNTPEILLGAEVRYYEGISHLADLSKLCIENSRLLLLEMSVSKWTEYTVKELTDLACSGNLTIIIAHVERYWKLQSNSVWTRLLENDILTQVNASFFTDFFTRKRALSMLKNNLIHCLGSDCHNTAVRPPRIGEAFNIIKSKMGEDYFNHLTEYGNSLLV